jgi:hypothetical protein
MRNLLSINSYNAWINKNNQWLISIPFWYPILFCLSITLPISLTNHCDDGNSRLPRSYSRSIIDIARLTKIWLKWNSFFLFIYFVFYLKIEDAYQDAICFSTDLIVKSGSGKVRAVQVDSKTTVNIC